MASRQMIRFLATLGTTLAICALSAGAQSSASGASPVSNRVHRQLGAPPARSVEPERRIVEIFVTAWCPYCRSLESYLTKRGITFTRYDVEHDAKGITIYQELGGGGVPIIRIDGTQILRGFSIDELEKALRTGAKNSEIVVRTIDIEDPPDLVKR